MWPNPFSNLFIRPVIKIRQVWVYFYHICFPQFFFFRWSYAKNSFGSTNYSFKVSVILSSIYSLRQAWLNVKSFSKEICRNLTCQTMYQFSLFSEHSWSWNESNLLWFLVSKTTVTSMRSDYLVTILFHQMVTPDKMFDGHGHGALLLHHLFCHYCCS